MNYTKIFKLAEQFEKTAQDWANDIKQTVMTTVSDNVSTPGDYVPTVADITVRLQKTGEGFRDKINIWMPYLEKPMENLVYDALNALYYNADNPAGTEYPYEFELVYTQS